MSTLEERVDAHDESIIKLQESQKKLERDYDTLYNLWKIQNDNIKELKDDIKGDMAELKKDIREDIQSLGRKHDAELKTANERWPKRAHFAFEAVLAAVAALEYIRHLHGW